MAVRDMDNIIRDVGLKKFVNLLEPGYTITKRSTISEAITLKNRKLQGQI